MTSKATGLGQQEGDYALDMPVFFLRADKSVWLRATYFNKETRTWDKVERPVSRGPVEDFNASTNSKKTHLKDVRV